ncbi:MAG: TlpA family protein disulfide reductase [Nitrospira sp.]|nr:TlpA family protein disulfide reductase [bacterium]MBL7048709.1 TlpA family protein disulfide reductase [Nitrospira sp.]
MNNKGPILIIIIALAVAAMFLMPETKKYEEVASIGNPAPKFELYDADGKLWKLTDLKGKVVFINFWATWCVTCKAEMPSKEALFKIMQGRDFQMLGMLFRDDPANLVDYKKKQPVSPPTLISPGNESAKMFGITGVPETFIIDKEGIIREKIVGPGEWDSEETLAMIEKWL